MTRTDFLKEHLEDGIVLVVQLARPCVMCNSLTKYREPIHRAYVCCIECHNNLVEVIEKAQNNQL